MMAVRARRFLLEIEFSAVGTPDDVSRYLHAAARADGSFVAHLMATFRAFDDH